MAALTCLTIHPLPCCNWVSCPMETACMGWLGCPGAQHLYHPSASIPALWAFPAWYTQPAILAGLLLPVGLLKV